MDKKIDSILRKATDKILHCEPSDLPSDGLFGGKLDLVLYGISLYKARGDDAHKQLIERTLECVFQSMDRQGSELLGTKTLVGGTPGLGLILDSLIKSGMLEETYRKQVDIISESAFENGMQLLSESNFDYFYGVTGLLFYLTEVGAIRYASRMAEALYQHGRTHDYLFYNAFGDLSMQGINFGFAHGSLSIIAVLLKIKQETQECNHSSALILPAMDALLKFKRGTVDPSKVVYATVDNDRRLSDHSFFPYNITTKRADHRVKADSNDNRYLSNRRLAWCNSDLGCTLMLYKLAELGGKRDYIQIADAIGNELARRKSSEETAVTDGYLCHGSAGIAMLFEKLFEITQKALYRDAYEHWIAATADFMEAALEKPFKVENMQILTGWLGSLLVLHGYRDKAVTAWKSIFLV